MKRTPHVRQDSASNSQSPLSVLDARDSSSGSLASVATSMAASAAAVRGTAAPEVHAAAVQQLQAGLARTSLTSIPEASAFRSCFVFHLELLHDKLYE
jgi:hypothetical protein